MLSRSEPIQAVPVPGTLRPGFTLQLLLLSLVLGLTTLEQTFHVLPYPNLFIRWCELLFAGLFLLEARSYEAPVLRPSAAGWVFLAWAGAAIISVALAPNRGPALIRQAEWLTHFLFATTLWSCLKRHTLPYKLILAIIPAGFMLFSLYLLATWMTLPNPRDYNWFYGTPLIGHARHFGYYALVALLFSTAPLLGFGRPTSWSGRILALVALSVCWGALFWAGGRAALGSAVVGVAFILWFVPIDQRLWHFVLILAAAGVGLLLSFLFLVHDDKMGFLFSLERTVDNAANYGVDGFTTGRLTIWRVALTSLDGHWLFGLGPDGYRFIETPHHGIQPHGMLVQFLVEWGAVGTIPFLALLFMAFKTGWQRLRQEQDPLRKTARVIAFAAMGAATLHALVDGLYYHAQPLLFLFTCFAITLLPVAQEKAAAQAASSLAWLTSRRVLLLAAGLLAIIFVLNSNLLYAQILHILNG